MAFKGHRLKRHNTLNTYTSDNDCDEILTQALRFGIGWERARQVLPEAISTNAKYLF
jgi:hypothetical protein